MTVRDQSAMPVPPWSMVPLIQPTDGKGLGWWRGYTEYSCWIGLDTATTAGRRCRTDQRVASGTAKQVTLWSDIGWGVMFKDLVLDHSIWGMESKMEERKRVGKAHRCRRRPKPHSPLGLQRRCIHRRTRSTSAGTFAESLHRGLR
jgi:hypothetical protein